MRGWGLLCVCGVTSLWACGAELGGPEESAGPGGWSQPAAVAGASSGVSEDDPTLGSSMNELFFSYEDPTDRDNKHLYYMTRQGASGAWSTPQALPFNERGSVDQTPRLSGDERTLYFASDRDPHGRGLDIWQVPRDSVGGPWGTPQRLDELDDPNADDKWLAPCSGGRYLMISQRDRSGGDVYEGVLGNGAPVPVPELSSMRGETGTFLAADCLTIHFASSRTGDNRIYTAHRGSVGDRWSDPVEVADFDALGGNQEDPWLSPDGRTFVFVSDVAGSKDVYLSTR